MKKKSLIEKKKLVEDIDAAKKRSDLSVKEICKAHGISDGSYYTWRKEIRAKESDNSTLAANNKDEIEEKIVELKRKHPYYGQNKIIKQLERFHGIKITRNQIKSTLKKHNMLETSSIPRRNKGKRRFERLEPGEMLQMDIMVYTLRKKQRFYLISALDDYSRFILAYKVCAKQTADNVIDTLQKAVEKHGAPKEVLSDRGGQFHSWKGMSHFTQILEQMGIRHILASPQSPQTIGKLESFHRNIQRELLRQQEFASVSDARDAIEEYIEYYNYERVHMGIDYVTPSDRFFRVDSDVKNQMKTPSSVYLTARIDGQPLRAEKTDTDKMVVKLAGKKVKEIHISALKSLLL